MPQIKARKKRLLIEKRNLVWTHLTTHPCVDCGESDPIVLEFDHVRGVKTKVISLLIGDGSSVKWIREEIAKCEVRCANCHRRKTAKDWNWYKVFQGENNA